MSSSPFRLAGLLVLSLAGCQGRGDLQGVVAYKDKTVQTGTVQAVGSDGLVRPSLIQDGAYHIKDLPSGSIRIAVTSPDPGKLKVVSRKKDQPPPAPVSTPGWFAIPEKYADLSKPALTFDLRGGGNTFNIKLED